MNQALENENTENSYSDTEQNVCPKELQNESGTEDQNDILEEEDDNKSATGGKIDCENAETSSRNIEKESDILLAKEQEMLEETRNNLKLMEAKCKHLETVQKDLKAQLENEVKRREIATKEKEAMVIRYAVSEKNVLKEKQGKEQLDKKYKELCRENEIMQHKLQSMASEKSRICQMLDNKCYEHRTVQQELERTKADLSALETKLKWSQNSLKTEMELHKETQSRVENLNVKLQETVEKIESTKREAQESIKNFHVSQDNRAHVLEQQLKENQATLILLKHERDDKDQQLKSLNLQLEKLQTKQKEVLQENNDLSLKIQHLERDRMENVQKLSELKFCADQQRQDSADLQAKTSQLDQLKLQLANEQDQLRACKEQVDLLKQRNSELELDMSSCREREAELLLFTQQLTDKNVRLQSEFTALETKVQQLTCEQTLLKRQIKEQETRAAMLSSQLSEERLKNTEQMESLKRELAEKSQMCDRYRQQVADEQGENSVIKRKYELSFRELNRELHLCRKRLEQYESSNIINNTRHTAAAAATTASTSTSCSSHSNSSSNSSLSVTNGSGSGGGSVEQQGRCSSASNQDSPVLGPTTEQVKVIQPDPSGVLDRQTLIEHIVKLQRLSARKSEKIDFLEEHVNTLVVELQKKSRLLQSYILRDQSGVLTSNTMDNNKANIAKMNGIMASVYSSRIADQNLTLELSLDINRKLQAVLEDALLKNITLKDNVDTLGQEIDKLNRMLKSRSAPS